MGNKKKKKRKKQPIDYEGYQFGPIKLERFDRTTLISSNWNEGEHKKFLERIREDRPKHKESINEKIQELIEIFRNNNPFELLTSISFHNCLGDPEIYKESTSEKREIYVEYPLGIVAGISDFNFDKHADEDALNRCQELVQEIVHSVIWYFAGEAAEEGSDLDSHRQKFQSIGRYLMVRGDSYPEHHVELIRGLFTEHNNFLMDNFGFSIDKILSAVNNIERQIEDNIEQHRKIAMKMKELHEDFKNQADAGGFDDCEDIDDLRKKYLSSQKTQEGGQELEKLHKDLPYIPFEIRPNATLSTELLDLLSIGLGENAGFLTYPKSPAWPTNNSMIYAKPIIKHDAKYYCFMPQTIFRNLKNIIEGWIQEKDNSYFEGRYQKRRGQYLESKAMQYLGNLLPNSKRYQSLHYKIIEDGEEKECETDGLVFYDNIIFILEAKAGTFSLASRRGAERSIKSELDEILEKAYSQALRTKDYIENNEAPELYDDNGNVISLQDKGKFKNIFLLNITLENIGQWSANLNSAKKLNLLQGHEWPWSVFINDLRIISEIVEYPSAFILYLNRRIRANDFPQFEPYDEIDFLMFFFNDGLYFEGDQLPPDGSVSLSGYTEDLDRYYDFIAGRVSSGEKPKIKTNAELQNIIREIEYKCNNKINFTEITTALLGFSAKSQEDYISYFHRAINLANQDERSHDFTLVTPDFGFTTFITKNYDQFFSGKADDYCYTHMYEAKKDLWYCLFIDIENFENKSFDFKIYEKKWEYDKELEIKVADIKRKRADRIKTSYPKVGRNDPCPCGSGKKYKKCCGKT